MGYLLSKVAKKPALSSSASKPQKVLLLGLDGAGKTTIVNTLKLNGYMSIVPKINSENVGYKSLRITSWDVGGQEKIRESPRKMKHNEKSELNLSQKSWDIGH